MNTPDRFEKFVVPDHLRKYGFYRVVATQPAPLCHIMHRVEYRKDTKLKNAGTFIFQREDHTIGNVLRMCVNMLVVQGSPPPPNGHHRKLLEDPDVLFAGYKMPHPLEYQMVVKVQTTGRNGYSPVQAVASSLNALSDEFADILGQFQVWWHACLKNHNHEAPHRARRTIWTCLPPWRPLQPPTTINRL